MNNTWHTKKKVNEFIELLAISPVKQFYPTAVPKYCSDISLELAFNELLKLCESGEIQLLWEVKCPGESEFCLRSLDKVKDFNPILNKEYFCDICGSENILSPSHIFPLFEINNDYREFMRSEYKKKTNHTGRMRLEVKSKIY